ncbi:MAG TPA: hypothetical protein VGH72_33915 [Pseudonocardia sp.]|jgi:hypothetical protein
MRKLDREKLIVILEDHFDNYLPTHHTPEAAAGRAADEILAAMKTEKEDDSSA